MSNILHAKETDLDEVYQLYKLGVSYLESNGIYQWDDQYPSKSDLIDDIKSNSVFLLKESNQLAGAITLDNKQDEQWANLSWAYSFDSILSLHRLCIHPDYSNRGYAKLLMEYAERFALNHGYQVIRLDSFLGNPFSQKLYPKLGYKEAIGYCYYHPNQIMCNGFEKLIQL